MICSVVTEKLDKNDIGSKFLCFSLTGMPHSECLCTQSPSWTACVRSTRPRQRGSSNSTTSTARNTSTTKEFRSGTPFQSFPFFIKICIYCFTKLICTTDPLHVRKSMRGEVSLKRSSMGQPEQLAACLFLQACSYLC